MPYFSHQVYSLQVKAKHYRNSAAMCWGLPGTTACPIVTWLLKAKHWRITSNCGLFLKLKQCLWCMIVDLPFSLFSVDRLQLRWLFLSHLAQPTEQMGKEIRSQFHTWTLVNFGRFGSGHCPALSDFCPFSHVANSKRLYMSAALSVVEMVHFQYSVYSFWEEHAGDGACDTQSLTMNSPGNYMLYYHMGLTGHYIELAG